MKTAGTFPAFVTILALLMLPMWSMAAAMPRIAIIIDDIGPRYLEGKQAVALPGPVTTAFLPQTANTRSLAEAAHASGKEVMLHLPLEATNGKALGPGGITLQMDEVQFLRTLRENIDSVPHARGVNNHMGSLLTRHPGAMTWLMRELGARGNFYFIDSRTHADTVALQMAEEAGIPRAKRDVFLDNVQEPDAIAAEFERLVALAKANGQAVAIGHPYPETMAFLADVLPRLEQDFGVRLVPASDLLEGRMDMISPGPRRSRAGKAIADGNPAAENPPQFDDSPGEEPGGVNTTGGKEERNDIGTRPPR